MRFAGMFSVRALNSITAYSPPATLVSVFVMLPSLKYTSAPLPYVSTSAVRLDETAEPGRRNVGAVEVLVPPSPGPANALDETAFPLCETSDTAAVPSSRNTRPAGS